MKNLKNLFKKNTTNKIDLDPYTKCDSLVHILYYQCGIKFMYEIKFTTDK